MKNFFLLLICLFHIKNYGISQTFQKIYGGSGMDEGNCVRETSDNGYFIVGTTTSYGAGGRDILAIKTNSAGDTLWTKTFGGDIDNEYGYSGQQTSDGGYIISGIASSFNDYAGDVYLIKLNSAGEIQWSNTYGASGYEGGYFVQQTTDGGYIVIGQTPAFGGGGFDLYLLKLNSVGDISWTKTFGGSGLELGFAVQQTTDGGYILSGQIDSYGAGFGDVFLVKTDANGTATWKKAIGTDNEESGIAVKQTTDGGYIVAGNTQGGTGTQDMWLTKVNADGSLNWSKSYGGPQIDECYDVIQTTDGGYILCGKSFSFSAFGDYDVYVVKVNSNGDVAWSKTYGLTGTGADNDIGYSIQQTSDGGYIISGETFYGNGIKNMYLIKTDANGNSGCNQSTPSTITSTISPQVIDSPVASGSGGSSFTPTTLVNSGSAKTILCQNIPLPVEFMNLISQNYHDNSVLLTWFILSENQNRGFDIERSYDGISFESIAFVHSKGNSTDTKEYKLIDIPKKEGFVYYRLKQIDIDGKFNYSKVTSAFIKSTETIKVSPNPAQANVRISTKESFTRLQILDTSGQLISDIQTAHQNIFNFDISNLRDGFYLIILKNENHHLIEKLVVCRN